MDSSPPSCNLGVTDLFLFLAFLSTDFTDVGNMATAHDRAVLQAIFNPTSPFGDIPDLNQEEELIDDGKRELFGLMFLCISCHSILNLFEHIPLLVLKKHDIVIQAVFSLPRYLSIEFECFFNLFISSCQTVALTQSC